MVDIYRAITLFLTIAALITWIIWLIRNPHKWGYALWVIIWLVNIMVFYASLLLADSNGVIDTLFFNRWSIIIRWQALISVLTAAIFWWNNGRKKSRDLDYV